MTNGGQRYRDQVSWTVPAVEAGGGAVLPARAEGEHRPASGRSAPPPATPAGWRRPASCAPSFQGTSLLQWHAELDPQVSAGQQRILTVRVENRGGEAAKNVRLRVELPQQVSMQQATPKNRSSANMVEFDAVSVPANGEETFTITYKAERAGQAYFILKLAADTLGEQPLTKEQAVEITGGR